jgi:hypothetical protein
MKVAESKQARFARPGCLLRLENMMFYSFLDNQIVYYSMYRVFDYPKTVSNTLGFPRVLAGGRIPADRM